MSHLHFSDSYATAREEFLTAAESRQAQLSSLPIRERGPRGEELAIDTAYLGTESPRGLLLISSGIHGVEGYAGSALQHQLLTEQLDGLDLPPHTGLLLIHAINPYGFAYTRRVNESNVDLNRNFLRHPEEHADNRDYDQLCQAINPRCFDEEEDRRGRMALLSFAQEHGFPRLQAVLSCGQYSHPEGMQFGGGNEEVSNRHLRRILRENRRGSSHVAWLDLHTGLGPYGDYELVSQHQIDAPAYLIGRHWFGNRVRTTLTGESASAYLFGDMLDGAVEELGTEATVIPFAPEFGTYEVARVFQAMRADNWLTHHGELDSERGRQIKAELLEVFRPSDPHWQQRVLQGGAEVIRRARDGLAALA